MELIKDISDVQVVQNPQEPREIFISLSVISQSGDKSKINFSIKRTL